MRAYVLVEVGDDQAIDVFVRRDDAFAALEDAITDEPDWAGILYVAPIELDDKEVSLNLTKALGSTGKIVFGRTRSDRFMRSWT